eukprot:2551169-Prymnesium_polylepis.3
MRWFHLGSKQSMSCREPTLWPIFIGSSQSYAARSGRNGYSGGHRRRGLAADESVPSFRNQSNLARPVCLQYTYRRRSGLSFQVCRPIRPGAGGLDDRCCVREGRTTSSTLSYV